MTIVIDARQRASTFLAVVILLSKMNLNNTALNYFVSLRVPILPGWDFTRDCIDPANLTDTTCGGGFASINAVLRHSRGRGDGPSFFMPELDRLSKFVQMHPSWWGVNKEVSRDYFGWDSYLTYPSVFSASPQGETDVRSDDFAPVITNADLPPASPWYPFVKYVHFHEETGATFINILDEADTSITSPAGTLQSALDYVAFINENSGCDKPAEASGRCWLPPIVDVQNVPRGHHLDACLEVALNHPHPPLVLHEPRGDVFSSPMSVTKGNRTVRFSVSGKYEMLSQLRLEVGYNGQNERVVTNVEFIEHDIEDLPLELKDDEYVKDQTYLRALADEAIANDPVVGRSGFMPLINQICMGGKFTSLLQ